MTDYGLFERTSNAENFLGLLDSIFMFSYAVVSFPRDLYIVMFCWYCAVSYCMTQICSRLDYTWLCLCNLCVKR